MKISFFNQPNHDDFTYAYHGEGQIGWMVGFSSREAAARDAVATLPPSTPFRTAKWERKSGIDSTVEIEHHKTAG